MSLRHSHSCLSNQSQLSSGTRAGPGQAASASSKANIQLHNWKLWWETLPTLGTPGICLWTETHLRSTLDCCLARPGCLRENGAPTSQLRITSSLRWTSSSSYPCPPFTSGESPWATFSALSCLPSGISKMLLLTLSLCLPPRQTSLRMS